MPKYVGLFSKDLINSRENLGCEFWKNGKIKYRGKFSNDSKNGTFGVSYCANGSLYYAGGYEDGKFSGKGICYWDSTGVDRKDFFFCNMLLQVFQTGILAQNSPALVEIGKLGELPVKFSGIWQILAALFKTNPNCKF
jgi:hypothetical protein